MSILTRPVEEILTYILTRLHGGILENTLNSQHFEARVSEGHYILKDLTLNPSVVNKSLKSIPLHITKASIGRIHIQMPSIFKFLESPISVSVKHLIVECCSASHSGYSVAERKEDFVLYESNQDIEGVTLLTKAIGNFLSNISFKVDFAVFRIRSHPSDKDFIQIFMPHISIEDYECTEQAKQKILRVENTEISLLDCERDVFEPQDPDRVLTVQSEIIGNILISKDEVKVSCNVPCVKSIASKAQTKRMLEILMNLEPTSLIAAEDPLIFEAYQELREDIFNAEELKHVQIRSLSIELLVDKIIGCFLSEECRKDWEYQEGVYPCTQESHIYVMVDMLKIHSHEISVKDVKIMHFELSRDNTVETEMFKTANSVFTSDFFRTEVYSDSLKYIQTDVISFLKEETVAFISIRNPKTIMNLAPFELRVSQSFIDYFSDLIETKTSSSSEFPSLKLECASIKLSLEYKKIDLFCGLKDLSLDLDPSQISSVIRQLNFELKYKDKECFLCISHDLSVNSTHNSKEELHRIDTDADCIRYFEQDQGVIIIPNHYKAAEVYSQPFNHVFEFEKHMKKDSKRNVKSVCHRIHVRDIEITLFPQIMRLKKYSTRSNSQNPQKFGIEWDIDDCKINLYESEDRINPPLEINLANIQGTLNQGWISLEIHYLSGLFNSQTFIQSYSSPILCTIDPEIQLSVSNLSIFTENLMFVTPILQNYMESGSSESSTLSLTLNFSDIILDYINLDHRLILLLDEIQVTSKINANSLSFHAKLRSARMFIKELLEDRFHLTLDSLSKSSYVCIGNIELLDLYCTIIKSMSFESTGISQHFFKCMFGPTCKQSSNNFFIAESVPSLRSSEDWIYLHINIGCLMLHFCKDSLEAFKNMIPVAEPPLRSPSVTVKDSGISSDDSDTYSVNPFDLPLNLVEPGNPFINLQEHSQLLENKEPRLSLPELSKFLSVETNEYVHLHPSLPHESLSFLQDRKFKVNTEEFPQQRSSANLTFLSVHLYAGNDFGGTRDISKSLLVHAHNWGIGFAKFPADLTHAWKLSNIIQRFEIIDKINCISFISTDESPQEFLELEVKAVFPRPGHIQEVELIINCNLKPIYIKLDQYMLDFMIDFWGIEVNKERISRNLGSTPTSNTENAREEKSVYIQRLTVGAIVITADYIPHSVMDSRSYTHIFNMFRVDKLRLCFNPVELTGVSGLKKTTDLLWDMWFSQIYGKEMIKLAAHIGPFSSLKNIASALYNVCVLPSSTDRPIERSKIAILGLVKVLSLEGLSLTEGTLHIAYDLVQGIGNSVGLRLPTTSTVIKPIRQAQAIINK